MLHQRLPPKLNGIVRSKETESYGSSRRRAQHNKLVVLQIMVVHSCLLTLIAHSHVRQTKNHTLTNDRPQTRRTTNPKRHATESTMTFSWWFTDDSRLMFQRWFTAFVSQMIHKCFKDDLQLMIHLLNSTIDSQMIPNWSNSADFQALGYPDGSQAVFRMRGKNALFFDILLDSVWIGGRGKWNNWGDIRRMQVS